ncbi:MAG: hypothetical protein WC867_06735 [Candidatus Pacearchaeota archaeon]|jgi:5'-nucleotidase
MKNDILIVNPKDFEKKLNEFIESGIKNLHILSDFDKTLTKAYYHSKTAGSLISHLRNGNYLSKDYSEKAHSLYNKYHPIEIDTLIPLVERKIKMQEWWEKHMQLLIDSGFDLKTMKKSMKDMIKEDTLDFRSGVITFLKLLDEKKIPLVIITSSLGDLIKEFMNLKKVYFKNTHIIGNNFLFDDKGKAKGNSKIIHVYNKHEFELETMDFFPCLLKRKNIILLGDSIGDLGMVEGFPFENLIKIGFLNENINDSLEEYKKNFDVLILNDSDFSFINDIIKKIIDKKL